MAVSKIVSDGLNRSNKGLAFPSHISNLGAELVQMGAEFSLAVGTRTALMNVENFEEEVNEVVEVHFVDDVG
jgi:hypothetical protein